MNTETTKLDRAEGCLLGQLAGDALGSLVEFRSAAEIRHAYPNGVREMEDGGTFDTIAGQPTDDSELALMLARSLADLGIYDPKPAFAAYRFWLNSSPFDCGATIGAGLRGRPNADSQSNGALMRISPLGIFGANYGNEQVADWAAQDARLTHPNRVCRHANVLFTVGIAHAIRTGCSRQAVYQLIRRWAIDKEADPVLVDAIEAAATRPPAEYSRQMGWVVIAFHNAFHQLLLAPNVEEALADTISHGGDTDTNAAICGALLGAVYGRHGIPTRWVDTLLQCRPKAHQPGVRRPRPHCFWPVDAIELAGRLAQERL